MINHFRGLLTVVAVAAVVAIARYGADHARPSAQELGSKCKENTSICSNTCKFEQGY